MCADRRVRSVLVTGGSGYIGRQFVARLADDLGEIQTLVSLDLREVPIAERLQGVTYAEGDVRGVEVAALLAEHAVDTVVHLAAVVSPQPGQTRDLLHSIDVGGTQNVLDACVEAKVGRLVVTSSGAAYGYHADNPVPLTEEHRLRGNPEFAYSDHKRIVEEMLERYRREHPALEQVVLRPGTILGETAENQITDLFEKPVVLGIAGAATPFVFIWDEDVVGSLVVAIRSAPPGAYNLAGDGAVPLAEIARIIGKTYVPLPAWLIRAALRVLHPLGLSQYGPEQVDFLAYRPVLSNEKLKSKLGYAPKRTSREVFQQFWRVRSRQRDAPDHAS